MNYVNEKNTEARTNDGYGKVITQIAQEGICPFCPEHLTKYHKHPLEEKKFWWLTDNAWPYKPRKHHRLLISKTHIVHFTEITPEAWGEIREIVAAEVKRLNIEGGTFILRFGDTGFTGGSVSHLHLHLFQSDPKDSSYDRKMGVLMRIG